MVHFRHADLPVGVVYPLVVVGEEVGGVPVVCIVAEEVGKEEGAEVRDFYNSALDFGWEML